MCTNGRRAFGEGCGFPDEDPSQTDKIIGASVGGSLLLLASVGVVSGLLIYRRREVEVHVHTITTSLSPSN